MVPNYLGAPLALVLILVGFFTVSVMGIQKCRLMLIVYCTIRLKIDMSGQVSFQLTEFRPPTSSYFELLL